ncbi:hypothetical protein DFP72DRAFT_845753 [Ephemerocybe angulata]|uniref:Uncharacterized protein n=1 Tax=Ephemerocybe angulata TaxID=980116 RepID=A0A8H6M7L7_9AGAR|nr:hypothetical protein DFP72DRAFT_845753 [Tulosesus angulatus]
MRETNYLAAGIEPQAGGYEGSQAIGTARQPAQFSGGGTDLPTTPPLSPGSSICGAPAETIRPSEVPDLPHFICSSTRIRHLGSDPFESRKACPRRSEKPDFANARLGQIVHEGWIGADRGEQNEPARRPPSMADEAQVLQGGFVDASGRYDARVYLHRNPIRPTNLYANFKQSAPGTPGHSTSSSSASTRDNRKDGTQEELRKRFNRLSEEQRRLLAERGLIETPQYQSLLAQLVERVTSNDEFIPIELHFGRFHRDDPSWKEFTQHFPLSPSPPTKPQPSNPSTSAPAFWLAPRSSITISAPAASATGSTSTHTPPFTSVSMPTVGLEACYFISVILDDTSGVLAVVWWPPLPIYNPAYARCEAIARIIAVIIIVKSFYAVDRGVWKSRRIAHGMAGR